MMPMASSRAEAGARPDTWSLNAATPLGSDKTPAPKIVLAKLNTLVGTSLFPSLLLLLLSWDAPATTDNTDRVLPGAPRPLPLMANADAARAAVQINKCPNFIVLLLLILKTDR